MDIKKPLIIVLAIAFYYPIIQSLIDTWSIDPYYSHGFLIPPISAYLIWRKKKILKESDKDFMQGIYLLGAGLAVYGYGLTEKDLFISSLSFIVVLAGLVLSFYGRAVLNALAFPIAFLIFMIPLPYADYASTHLQSYTASSSAALLNLLGIHVDNNGSQIRLGNDYFIIGDPCSGLRTMIALFALAALFAYVMDASMNKKLFLFLTALPIAFAANVLRVVSVLLVASWFGKDIAMGFFHGFSSLLLFIIAFLFLIIVGRCIGCKDLRNI